MKKIIGSIMLVLLPMLANAYDAQIDGIYYNFLGDEATITYLNPYSTQNSTAYSGDVTIPETITYNGKTYSVTSIGYGAFAGCSGLTSVTIPGSVTEIGIYAFSGCSGLTSITIPESVTSISNGTFSNCTCLTSVTIPESVTSIGDYAFRFCSGLISITIPNSVTGIGDSAFDGCSSLTSVTISNGVTSIGKYAFLNCSSLTSVYITNLAAWCQISFVDYASNPLHRANHLYMNDQEIKDLVIPESVTKIGDYAFYSCTGLTSVTIPNSVASIDGYAFYSCTGLTSATIPNSVASIDGYAFYGCSSLTSVTIPNGITSIRSSTFAGCTSLTSITIPNSVTSIGYGAFSGCSGLTSITIPNSVTTIDDRTFDNCSSLTSVNIPDGVTSIGNYVFFGCKSLASITIGTGLTSIAKKSIPAATIIYTIVSKSLITLWEAGYENIKDILNGRNLGVPKLSVACSSASSMTVSVSNAHAGFTNTLNVSGNKTTLEEENQTINLNGLEPDTQYEISLSLVSWGFSYELNKSIKTEALTFTTLQPKVISEGNVILAAQSNLDDEETNAGFEWRRIDWTDDFDSKTGAAIVYDGMMEGYIRSINSNYLWKFRPYYTSNAGNTYYGEWKGLDPSDYSYFEPTVRTYGTVNVSGNSAEVKGYAMRGTDKITSQGFMYWSTGSASSRRMANGVPSDATTVLANGNVMTATLENLEYNTQYSCVAFVTTEENETFYGEEQTFTTDASSYTIGDLNYDNKVDIADAVTVLNIMASGEYNKAADLNGDNKNDIADFVTVLNIMAGQGGE